MEGIVDGGFFHVQRDSLIHMPFQTFSNYRKSMRHSFQSSSTVLPLETLTSIFVEFWTNSTGNKFLLDTIGWWLLNVVRYNETRAALRTSDAKSAASRPHGASCLFMFERNNPWAGTKSSLNNFSGSLIQRHGLRTEWQTGHLLDWKIRTKIFGIQEI